MKFTDKQIQGYLKSQWGILKKGLRHTFPSTKNSFSHFPEDPGVYCIWEDGVLCYVGETASLRPRMRNLTDTRNHTFRKKVGKYHFSKTKGYEPATSSKKFPEHIEKLLNAFLKKHMKVSLAPVFLGRKEVEDYIYHIGKPRYNSEPKRGQHKK